MNQHAICHTVLTSGSGPTGPDDWTPNTNMPACTTNVFRPHPAYHWIFSSAFRMSWACMEMTGSCQWVQSPTTRWHDQSGFSNSYMSTRRDRGLASSLQTLYKKIE